MRAYTFPQLTPRAKSAAVDTYWRDALTDAPGLNVTRQDHGQFDMHTLAWTAMFNGSYIFNEHGERLAY